MGMVKEYMIEQAQKEADESYECASCGCCVPLDIDDYESIAELKEAIEIFEAQFALCEYCKDRNMSL